jgi:hypothetical protein
MSLFPESKGGGKFVFLPKVGESLTVVVLGQVTRVNEPESQFNYKKQGNINAGYHDLLPIVNDETGEETNLLINVWKFYFQLKEQEGLDVGDTLLINHSDRGTYKITKK